jgi:hypothetical protein
MNKTSRAHGGRRRVLTTAVAATLAIAVGGTIAAVAAGAPTTDPKSAELQREAAARQAAAAHAADKSTIHAPAPTQQAARVPGIYANPQGPLPPSQMSVDNSWMGPVQGHWLLAYAGEYFNGDGTSDPVVLLCEEPMDPNAPVQTLTQIGLYRSASAVGALTITDEQGSSLLLQDAAGHDTTFDLVSRSFG